jgi:thiol:disulfide interchange protein
MQGTDSSHARSSRGIYAAALATIVLAPLAFLEPASAQLPDLSNFRKGLGGGLAAKPAEVTVKAEFTPATDAQPAMLFVTATIADGYHVYAIDQQNLPDGGGGPQPTAIKLAPNQAASVIGTFHPIEPPAVHLDEKVWKGLELREHTGRVIWYAPIDIAKGANLDELELTGSLEGQACTASVCVPINLKFTAERGEGVPIPEQPVEVSSSPQRSLWVVAFYGLLGGVILNLMPCVLPVIGLKIFSFAKQGGQSRGHVFGLNLSYTAGLLTVFMVLATLAAAVQLGIGSSNLGWGEIYTYTWFKVSMTALVFAMALSFLGVWEIPIPGFATSGKATSLAAQEGMFGAFFMGIITTLLAVPCSGPFLGPVFGFTISQPTYVTYVVFAAVGIGMALPYLLIGAFPSLIAWLPKPGAWMDTLKNLMGFGLLATVVYLFSTINEDFFLATLSLLFAIWFGCWIIGRTPAYAPARDRIRAWVAGSAVAAIIGFGAFMLMTPSKSALPWQPYSPQALAMARAQGKTVLVDFTANWCPTCKTNLAFAINREEVKQLVEKNDVVPLLADWSDKNDTIKNALLELNSKSIPLMAIYPADPSREVMVLPDLLTKQNVLDALTEAGPSLGEDPLQRSASAAGEDPLQRSGEAAPDAPDFGAARLETSIR